MSALSCPAYHTPALWQGIKNFVGTASLRSADPPNFFIETLAGEPPGA